MRYVCYKSIISRVVDEKITSSEDRRAILSAICENGITCSLHLKEGVQFPQVRITKITETKIEYVVYTAMAILKKTSVIDEIEYLEVTVSDKVLAYVKPKTDRWDLLDPMDFDEET